MGKYDLIEIGFDFSGMFKDSESKLRTNQGPVSLKRIRSQLQFDKCILTDPLWGYKLYTFTYAIKRLPEHRKILFRVFSIIENANRTYVAINKNENIIRIIIPVSEAFVDNKMK